MRKIYLIICFITISLVALAQEERIIHVETAGTLNTFINDADKYNITKLTVTGKLNGNDFILLRDMAGAKGVNSLTDGQLTELDLSGVDIVTSDDVYFSYANQNYKTADNVFGSFLMYNSKKLTTLKLPESIVEIGTQALSGCSNLSEIDIPESVTSIGSGVFLLCDAIKKIVVPDNVTTLGIGAFQRMGGLEEIYFGSGLTALEASLLVLDNSLKLIHIGKNIESIDPVILYTLPALETLTVDNDNSNYSALDGVLFNKDKSVLVCYPCARVEEGYVIPPTVEELGSNCFANVYGMQSLTIPSYVKTIGEGVFSGCVMSEIILEDGVESIGYGAFANTVNLVTIDIPASVNELVPGAFSYAVSLLKINVDENNENYASDNGILYSKDKTVLIAFPAGCTDEVYTTEPSVTEIAELAFSSNMYLKTIKLNNNIQTVGDMAFSECAELNEVYCYPENLTDVAELAFVSENLMEGGTLYVPKGRVDFYLSQPWVYNVEYETYLFSNVEEMSDEAAAVETVTSGEKVKEIYSIDGRRLQNMQRGINILRQDGRIVKIVK